MTEEKLLIQLFLNREIPIEERFAMMKKQCPNYLSLILSLEKSHKKRKEETNGSKYN